MSLLRRTFLKVAASVCVAILGLAPDLAGDPPEPVCVDTGNWMIFVPPLGTRGPVVESGFCDERSALSAAKRFANGGPFKVMPQRGRRNISNGVPCHLHPLTRRVCAT